MPLVACPCCTLSVASCCPGLDTSPAATGHNKRHRKALLKSSNCKLLTTSFCSSYPTLLTLNSDCYLALLAARARWFSKHTWEAFAVCFQLLLLLSYLRFTLLLLFLLYLLLPEHTPRQLRIALGLNLLFICLYIVYCISFSSCAHCKLKLAWRNSVSVSRVCN